jgi:hypothetical protein
MCVSHALRSAQCPFAMAEPRSKRACTVRAQGPSSTHYVGYVEDDETPEAIMKKFEALERVQQRLAAGRGVEAAGADGAAAGAEEAGQEVLTEEQLLEVFKQTSTFTLQTLHTHDGMSWPRGAAIHALSSRHLQARTTTTTPCTARTSGARAVHGYALRAYLTPAVTGLRTTSGRQGKWRSWMCGRRTFGTEERRHVPASRPRLSAHTASAWRRPVQVEGRGCPRRHRKAC